MPKLLVVYIKLLHFEPSIHHLGPCNRWRPQDSSGLSGAAKGLEVKSSNIFSNKVIAFMNLQ